MVRLCLPEVELVDGEYHEGGGVAPTALAAHEERSRRRLSGLADRLVSGV
ncbi:hypothetical protein GCM10010430_24970 [Kitasatospora cystarginea]|uniref:Uncharacterized protein n=1 Tax=Kitasatospora cystarginea TaxID=58350 RepID=A0ABP5QU09_9ACTN